MSPALSAFLALLLALQGGSPASLRKTDLVRLLSGAGMSSVDLSQLVRRNCLTFQPTERDRNDLRMLGADASLLAAVDECARRKVQRRTASGAATRAATRPASAPAPAPPPEPPPVFQVHRIIVTVSAERSVSSPAVGSEAMSAHNFRARWCSRRAIPPERRSRARR